MIHCQSSKASQLVMHQLQSMLKQKAKLENPHFTQTLRIQNVQAFPLPVSTSSIAETSGSEPHPLEEIEVPVISAPDQQLIEMEVHHEEEAPSQLQDAIAEETPAQIEEHPSPAYEEPALAPTPQHLAHTTPSLVSSPEAQTQPHHSNHRDVSALAVPRGAPARATVATFTAAQQTQGENEEEGVPNWVKVAGGVGVTVAIALIGWLLWPKAAPTDLNGNPRRPTPRRQGKDSIQWSKVKPYGSGATTTTQPPASTGEGSGATTTTQHPASTGEGSGATTTAPSRGSEEDRPSETIPLSDDSSGSSSAPHCKPHRASIKNWAEKNGISPEDYEIKHIGQGLWRIVYNKDGQSKFKLFVFPERGSNKHTILPSPQAQAAQRGRESAPRIAPPIPVRPMTQMQSSTNGFLKSFFDW
ncbi:MAG: hypothetical protein V4492_01950 [Chlamydiota bacterium]